MEYILCSFASGAREHTCTLSYIALVKTHQVRQSKENASFLDPTPQAFPLILKPSRGFLPNDNMIMLEPERQSKQTFIIPKAILGKKTKISRTDTSGRIRFWGTLSETYQYSLTRPLVPQCPPSIYRLHTPPQLIQELQKDLHLQAATCLFTCICMLLNMLCRNQQALTKGHQNAGTWLAPGADPQRSPQGWNRSDLHRGLIT